MKAKTNTRQSQLAQIHIAKKQLGLDDDTYRAMLFTLACVQSSADLDYAGRLKVLAHLKACGFKAKPAKKSKASVPLSQEPQHKMMRGLWLELHQIGAVLDPSENALNRFIKNQIRVDRMEWLDSRQCSILIERLKSWVDRVEISKKGTVS